MAKVSFSIYSDPNKLTREADTWVARIEEAGRETMADLARETAEKAIEYAPERGRPDKRTKKLKDSITYESGSKYARIIVSARHGLIMERGAGPSKIPGTVSFFWLKEGRWWNPGHNIIEHPATAAQPYMRPAFEDIMLEWQEIARRHYPQ